MPKHVGAYSSKSPPSWPRSARQHRSRSLTGDRLLKVDEAASKLGVSVDYVYRHASKLPFAVRHGRVLRFSEQGIERYIRQRQAR